MLLRAEPLRKAANVAFPIALAAFLLLPVWKEKELSGPVLEARRAVADVMRPMSLSQQWGMYAPDPARSVGYMGLEALEKGGDTRPLWETEYAETAAWGTHWAGNKTRMAIWRYRLVSGDPKRPRRDRGWFLRSICVREARNDAMPPYIQMSKLWRGFNSPAFVRKGNDEFGRLHREPSDKGWCGSPLVDEMVEYDRWVRGLGPKPVDRSKRMKELKAEKKRRAAEKAAAAKEGGK